MPNLPWRSGGVGNGETPSDRGVVGERPPSQLTKTGIGQSALRDVSSTRPLLIIPMGASFRRSKILLAEEEESCWLDQPRPPPKQSRLNPLKLQKKACESGLRNAMAWGGSIDSEGL